MSESKRIKTALVSVYHKEGLDERPGWDIIFWEGTYREQIDDCDKRIKEMEALLTKIYADECYDFIGGE